MAWELILWILSFVSVISLIAMTAYQVFRHCCVLIPVGNSFFVLFGLGITLLQLDAESLFLILFPKIQLICLSDLEFDYINPYDSSSRINSVVIPEYIVQGLLCTSFLLTWHWFPFLIMAPVTYYHVKLFMNKKHLMDVTEIFRQLNGEKKQRLIKLVFYLSLFVIVIYRLVMTAVALLMEEDMTLLDSVTL